MNSKITADVGEQRLSLRVDNWEMEVDLKALMRAQKQSDWQNGISQIIRQVLDPLERQLQDEVEKSLHHAVIRGDLDYKGNT